MLLQILKKSTFFLCAGAMLVFTSCNEEETKISDTESETTESESETPRNAPNLNDPESQDGEGNADNNATQIAPIEMKTQGTDGVKLNPPHGQPGHDCGVEVGQPLNSSGSGSPISMPNMVQPKVNPSAKLNPPHGEPGHDCGVEVGQPLN